MESQKSKFNKSMNRIFFILKDIRKVMHDPQNSINDKFAYTDDQIESLLLALDAFGVEE